MEILQFDRGRRGGGQGSDISYIVQVDEDPAAGEPTCIFRYAYGRKSAFYHGRSVEEAAAVLPALKWYAGTHELPCGDEFEHIHPEKLLTMFRAASKK